MLRNWLKITLIVMLVAITAACSSPAPTPAPTDPSPPAEEASPTEAESAPEDVPEEEQTPVIDAAAIYSARCAGCHGADRSGANGPALLPERLTQDPAVYEATITDGSGQMPSFGSRLSGDEISALVEFIRSDRQ